MREIIIYHVGGCGSATGLQFWETISAEHGLDTDGVYKGTDPRQQEHIQTYYNNTSEGKFSPRAIWVDKESSSADLVKDSVLSSMFEQQNFVYTHRAAGGNWAKASFVSEKYELMDYLTDVVRKLAERCDSLQGFHMMHSPGGQTGSDLGNLLLNKMRTEYPDKIMNSISVFPSQTSLRSVVDPYNVVFSVHNLTYNSDVTLCVDNDAMFDIIQVQPCDIHKGVNRLLSHALSSYTSSFRFHSDVNPDLRKFATNMVSFPQQQYLMTSVSPLPIVNDPESVGSVFPERQDQDGVNKVKQPQEPGETRQEIKQPETCQGIIPGATCASGANVQSSVSETGTVDCIRDMFAKKNYLLKCNPENGKYLSAVANLRGQWSGTDFEEAFVNFRQSEYGYMSSNIKTVHEDLLTCFYGVPVHNLPRAVCLVSNNTSVADFFQNISDRYHMMVKKKAFFHWFIGDGMDEMEFHEAGASINDVLQGYRAHLEMDEDSGVKDDDGEEEGVEEDGRKGQNHTVHDIN